jgi:hypothetical protein
MVASSGVIEILQPFRTGLKFWRSSLFLWMSGIKGGGFSFGGLCWPHGKNADGDYMKLRRPGSER